MITITIDGLSTNGKTTLANLLAKKFNFQNFNTGAIYRCIALTMIRKHLDIEDIEKVLSSIHNIQISFKDELVFLNDVNVTEEIKSEDISFFSTKWATNLELKKFVRKYQQNFIKQNNTIMEGRDIGSRIAPNAKVKFYLYSDFETRVERKWLLNPNSSKEEIKKELAILDDFDLNHGNFVKPKNAFEIDTTHLTIEEVFVKMSAIIEQKLK